jgi:hypothetical protein
MFLSIHTMDGDPTDLLTRKAEHMGPVIERMAPGFGAVWSVTARTNNGIITVNLWDNPQGAAESTQHPEAQAASVWGAISPSGL